MVTRGHPPFQGKLAFPGGFVDYGEVCIASVNVRVRRRTEIWCCCMAELWYIRTQKMAAYVS